jgi:NAD(P)-dependent dehydrogenase (short-subunit alcohol dehydrogenase family)
MLAKVPSPFRDNLLAGKTAYVTGGSSGICLGIAERFVAQGARVAIQGRNREKLDLAVAHLSRQGGQAAGFSCDVRDYAATAAALGAAREQFGEIDILVCGAAGNFPSPALGMSANGFKAVVDIDLLGTFNTCRAAYEHLRKPGASVISISATHAFQPYAWQAHVCAAKSGVDMLTKVLAIEWGNAGVRLNIISPGPVDGTEGMRRLAPTEEARRRVIDGVPLRRFATIPEIADLALFLASDASAYMTGAVCVIDGGACLLGYRRLGE